PEPRTTELPLVPLSTIHAEAVPWLWPGYIPLCEPAILAGDPSTGKTLCGLDVLARITTGATWPDGVPNAHGPRNGILLSAEDANEYPIGPGIEAAGGDAARVYVVPADKVSKLSLDKDVARVRAAVEQVKPLAILIDPLSAYMPGTDTHRDNDVRSSLAV